MGDGIQGQASLEERGVVALLERGIAMSVLVGDE